MMKISLLTATVVLAAGLGVSAPAAAQYDHPNGDSRDMNRDRHDMNRDRHDMNGDRHDMNRDRRDWGRNHRGWHRHCWWTWRHHHRVRFCR
jgi:hypothetical protein